MSRGKKRIDRNITPDDRYGSVFLSKFVNYIMLSGKKEIAENILYGAIDGVWVDEVKKKYNTPVTMIEDIVNRVKPSVETKTKRVGGSNYRVPVLVPEYRSIAIGMKNIIKAAKGRSGKTFIFKLISEFADILDNKGRAMEDKKTSAKMAESNRAFAHLA